MCAVSNVGDHYSTRFQPYMGQVQQQGAGGMSTLFENIPRHEFEQLRKEVLEMKDLLIKAKEIDEKTKQPNCEQEDKVKILKEIAKIFAISLDEVFK